MIVDQGYQASAGSGIPGSREIPGTLSPGSKIRNRFPGKFPRRVRMKKYGVVSSFTELTNPKVVSLSVTVSYKDEKCMLYSTQMVVCFCISIPRLYKFNFSGFESIFNVILPHKSTYICRINVIKCVRCFRYLYNGFCEYLIPYAKTTTKVTKTANILLIPYKRQKSPKS